MELLQKAALLSIQWLNGTGDLGGDGLVLRSLALKSGSPCAGFCVKGVGDVSIFGSGAYSMRIWLDPPN